MMKTILFLIAILTYFLSTTRKLQKQLHFLQLNSYMNNRYVRWLRQNYARTWSVKEFLPVLSLPLLLSDSTLLAWLAWSGGYLFLVLRGSSAPDKKKLVFTPRAIRLFVTMLVVCSVFCGVGAWVVISANSLSSKVSVLLVFILINVAPFSIALVANTLVQPLEKAINHWYYDDARKRIQQMPRVQVIGITGSFGKTSTKTIVSQMLAEHFHVLMTPESYNTPMGVTKVIRNSLTPVHEMFVVEMGAKQRGDIRELCDLVSPRFGILTAIGEQHLETFGNLDNITRTKFELVESLPADGIAFLNMDNEHIRELAPLTQVKTVLYGIEAEGLHYAARNIQVSSTGSSFEFWTRNGEHTMFHTKLLGKHAIYNILAASAVACELKIDLPAIVAVVRTLTPVAHRLELKKTSQNITIIDDAFNSNPVGAHSALEVLQMIEGGKKILISPGMVELGEREYELNKAFGTHAAEVCDDIILVGHQQTRPIQEGLQAANYAAHSYYVAKNLQEANQHLWSIVQAGDVVLYENDLPDTYDEG